MVCCTKNIGAYARQFDLALRAKDIWDRRKSTVAKYATGPPLGCRGGGLQLNTTIRPNKTERVTVVVACLQTQYV